MATIYECDLCKSIVRDRDSLVELTVGRLNDDTLSVQICEDCNRAITKTMSERRAAK